MLRWKFAARSLVAASILTGTARGHAQANPLVVASPDHQITMRFAVKPPSDPAAEADGQLVYSVEFHGKPTFEDTALRLELPNQPPLGASVHITGTTSGAGIDDYRLVAGKTSVVHDSYNSLTIHV